MSRRLAENSETATGPAPRALTLAVTASPTGPAPMTTIPLVPLEARHVDRVVTDRPWGSVRAAWSFGVPWGTGINSRSESSMYSPKPPGASVE